METQPTIQLDPPISSEPLAPSESLGFVLLAILLSFIAGRLTTQGRHGSSMLSNQADRSRDSHRTATPLRSGSEQRERTTPTRQPVRRDVSTPASQLSNVASVLADVLLTPNRAPVRNEGVRTRMERTRSTAGGQLPDGVNQFGEIE